MNGHLCVAAIAVFMVAPNLAIDCSNNRCMTRGLTHIMCKYPDPNPALSCDPFSSVGFTAAEKKEIVDMHNERRQFVAAGKELKGNQGPQPIGYNMNVLFWDDELAELAQRWVNQCRYGPDDCRDVDRFVVGQNYAVLSSGDQHTTPSDVLMTWYNEVQYFSHFNVNNLPTVHRVGNYTQMVWGTTQMVGCGKILSRANGWNKYYMVCNYGPAGNWIGLPVYLAQI